VLASNLNTNISTRKLACLRIILLLLAAAGAFAAAVGAGGVVHLHMTIISWHYRTPRECLVVCTALHVQLHEFYGE